MMAGKGLTSLVCLCSSSVDLGGQYDDLEALGRGLGCVNTRNMVPQCLTETYGGFKVIYRKMVERTGSYTKLDLSHCLSG